MTTIAPTQLSGVTFGGILRSEWIKLMSLRSTIWCYAILVFLTLGLAALFGSTLYVEGMTLDHDTQQTFAVQAVTFSVGMSQLVVAVLGALVVVRIGAVGGHCSLQTGRGRESAPSQVTARGGLPAKGLPLPPAVW